MVLYVFVGFFDAFSVIALMFALYRFPLWEYKLNTMITAGIIAFTSYFIRIILEVPEIDPLIQIGILIILLRVCVKVKFKYSALIPTSAFAAYILVQAAIFNVLVATGVIHESELAQTDGVGTYIVQISSILAVYLISFAMLYLRFGFSFISRPPHNVNSKDRHSFKVLWPAIIMSLIGIAVSINALMSLDILLVVAIGFVMFSILYYLSYRRDKTERDRIYRTTNFRKDKYRSPK